MKRSKILVVLVCLFVSVIVGCNKEEVVETPPEPVKYTIDFRGTWTWYEATMAEIQTSEAHLPLISAEDNVLTYSIKESGIEMEIMYSFNAEKKLNQITLVQLNSSPKEFISNVENMRKQHEEYQFVQVDGYSALFNQLPTLTMMFFKYDEEYNMLVWNMVPPDYNGGANS